MAQAEPYIHSFRAAEQERLLHQARFLSPYTHARLDLSGEVLEVDCGVGAQIRVLLERFPDAGAARDGLHAAYLEYNWDGQGIDAVFAAAPGAA